MAVNPKYAPVVAGARAASRLSGNPTAPFASINAVQWAVESGYGRSQSGKNNFFGIKATQAQIAAGKATKRLTHETINGVYGPYNLYFADFDTEADCFKAHTALLTDPKMGWAYKDCWAAKDAEAYAMALQEHYATGIPGHPYGTTLIEWMRRDGLYELDNESEPKIAGAVAPKAGGAVVIAGAGAAVSHISTGSLMPFIIGAAILIIVALTAYISTRKV